MYVPSLRGVVLSWPRIDIYRINPEDLSTSILNDVISSVFYESPLDITMAITTSVSNVRVSTNKTDTIISATFDHFPSARYVNVFLLGINDVVLEMCIVFVTVVMIVMIIITCISGAV